MLYKILTNWCKSLGDSSRGARRWSPNSKMVLHVFRNELSETHNSEKEKGRWQILVNVHFWWCQSFRYSNSFFPPFDHSFWLFVLKKFFFDFRSVRFIFIILKNREGVQNKYLRISWNTYVNGKDGINNIPLKAILMETMSTMVQKSSATLQWQWIQSTKLQYILDDLHQFQVGCFQDQRKLTNMPKLECTPKSDQLYVQKIPHWGWTGWKRGTLWRGTIGTKSRNFSLPVSTFSIIIHKWNAKWKIERDSDS